MAPAALVELELELEQAEITKALINEKPTKRAERKYCFTFIEVLQKISRVGLKNKSSPRINVKFK
jgi:hypothetical protein